MMVAIGRWRERIRSRGQLTKKRGQCRECERHRRICRRVERVVAEKGR